MPERGLTLAAFEQRLQRSQARNSARNVTNCHTNPVDEDSRWSINRPRSEWENTLAAFEQLLQRSQAHVNPLHSEHLHPRTRIDQLLSAQRNLLQKCFALTSVTQSCSNFRGQQQK